MPIASSSLGRALCVAAILRWNLCLYATLQVLPCALLKDANRTLHTCAGHNHQDGLWTWDGTGEVDWECQRGLGSYFSAMCTPNARAC